MYDIVIIGAGPAGATLTRLLDKKYSVLLVDKRSFNNNRMEKCCGGLLAPDAQKMLAKLELGLPKDVLTGPQMFSVKTLDFDNDIERHYQRHYINVDRGKLDSYLVSQIHNADFMPNTMYKGHKKIRDIIEVTLNKNGENTIIETNILVGADGALSLIRKNEFKEKPYPEKYVSVQQWYKTDSTMPFYTSIFDKKITDYYSWIIQKEGYLLVGTAIPIKEDANLKFNLLIDKLKKKNFEIGKFYKRTGTLIMRTRKLNQISLVNNNVALIGEAAGLISPSSAEGISYALKSASYLAESINRNYKEFKSDYVKSARKIKINIFIKNLKIPFMYNPLIRKLVMKSRIFSMDIKR
jgi:geranylgeranyl diphosphate/geranylgeranyl-bacteriochlorophyllide a reductase